MTCKIEPDSYFMGTRCFSSSVQFKTILILRGFLATAGLDPTSFIVRNRLPAGLISFGSAI